MRFSQPTTLLLALSLSAIHAAAQSPLPYQNTSSSTTCAPVHLIVVRASTEKPGQGIIGTLATMISAANPGSSVEAIDYPALLDPYGESSANGTMQTIKQLKSYVDECDGKLGKGGAKVVLLGYSQGAHVIGDVMCGGGGVFPLGNATAPIDMKYASKVVAMIQMGDPRHMKGVSFDVGSSMNDGLFPRLANQSCEKFAPIIQSYCDTGDPFCDGGNVSSVHTGYTKKYNNDAFSFVMNKLQSTDMSGMSGMGMSGSGSASASMNQPQQTNSASYASSSGFSVLVVSGLVALFTMLS